MRAICGGRGANSQDLWSPRSKNSKSSQLVGRITNLKHSRSLPPLIGDNNKSQMPSIVSGELQMPSVVCGESQMPSVVVEMESQMSSVVVVEESQITNANTGEGLNYK